MDLHDFHHHQEGDGGKKGGKMGGNKALSAPPQEQQLDRIKGAKNMRFLSSSEETKLEAVKNNKRPPPYSHRLSSLAFYGVEAHHLCCPMGNLQVLPNGHVKVSPLLSANKLVISITLSLYCKFLFDDAMIRMKISFNNTSCMCKMRLSVAILLFFWAQAIALDTWVNVDGQMCPQCEVVDCHPLLEPRDCPEDSIFVPNMVWGCCPACVKYLQYGDQCDMDPMFKLTDLELLPCVKDDIYVLKNFMLSSIDIGGEQLLAPIMQVYQCGSGYICDETCTVDPLVNASCAISQERYRNWEEDQVETNECDIYDWPKSCTPSGHFQKSQTKTSLYAQQSASRKFCVDQEGKRIFGDAPIDDEEMTCQCSRKFNDMKELQLDDLSTLHCSSNGNFEELQCDQDRCWCLNPENGHVVSKIVHKDLVRYLPCYDSEMNGDQYLRRCESRRYGKAKADRIMQLHGLTWLEKNRYTCDPDGSFAPVNCKENENRCGCVDKSDNWIGSYKDATYLKTEFNCQCARDKITDDSIGLACNSRGNYETIQKFDTGDGTEFCVDEDGFQFTPQYPLPRNGDKKCNIKNCQARIDECVRLDANGQLVDNGQCQECASSCFEE